MADVKHEAVYDDCSMATELINSSAVASQTLTIVHFNDVYNIESRSQEPVGGAARFVTAVTQLAASDPVVLFSGDAFNPSVMSTYTKGSHMVPILNALNVQCAVYGNHDFDFGIDTLVKLAHETHFPWLLSNVRDVKTDQPLAEGITSHVITCQGRKIGLIGLVEEEWIVTLATVDPDDVIYLDLVEEGQRLAQELKQQGVDCVIALTHMRWPNDILLARSVSEIDLILGGHDHEFTVKDVNGKYIVKSGTDFRSFGKITLTFDESRKLAVAIEKIDIFSSIEEDSHIKDVVSKYMDVVDAEMETVLGEIGVELDGRFASIRNTETNLGNFVTDIMLEAMDTDVALLNAGTLRSDIVHPVGSFKLKDLLAILPMIDFITVLKISGQQIIDALENGVSKYPTLEGRFPQVAGISFGFDPKKLPGQRIDPRHVRVQGSFIELNKLYRLCTKSYLAEGKDGYDVFKSCEQLTNGDDSPVLSTLIQNHFKHTGVCRGRRRSSCCLQQNKPANRQKLAPDIEGRIIVISEEKDKALDDEWFMVCMQKPAISDDTIEHVGDRLSSVLP